MKEKMVKVKAVKDYYDKELKTNIRVANNEIYEVTEERYKVLTGNNPFKEIFVKEVKEKWKFCDFRVEKGTLENPIIISIGEIPCYKYDKEKVLVINFENEDRCYLSRGYAVENYASKILRKRYPIPKYMKKQLLEFIEKYKNKENIYDCRN